MEGTFHGWVEILVPFGGVQTRQCQRICGLPVLGEPYPDWLIHTGYWEVPANVTALRARVTSGQDIHVRVVVKDCRR